MGIPGGLILDVNFGPKANKPAYAAGNYAGLPAGQPAWAPLYQDTGEPTGSGHLKPVEFYAPGGSDKSPFTCTVGWNKIMTGLARNRKDHRGRHRGAEPKQDDMRLNTLVHLPGGRSKAERAEWTAMVPNGRYQVS